MSVSAASTTTSAAAATPSNAASTTTATTTAAAVTAIRRDHQIDHGGSIFEMTEDVQHSLRLEEEKAGLILWEGEEEEEEEEEEEVFLK